MIDLKTVYVWIGIALLAGHLMTSTHAHADASPIDRALVERLVRAVESLARATERCK